MSIKPIDIQTNLGQIPDVGKNEHVRAGALIEQQQALERESAEKARLTKSKLEETNKQEGRAIKDDQHEGKKERSRQHLRPHAPGHEGKDEKQEHERLDDDRMGHFIDVRK